MFLSGCGYGGPMRREEVERLFLRSRKFRDASEFHASRGDFDLAVFNLEQSLQLFLKAKLLGLGVDFPKIQGLRRLFRLIGEVSGRVGDFLRFEAEHALEFASLEDAYVTARYFPREFSREEAERLRKFVDEVERFVG